MNIVEWDTTPAALAGDRELLQTVLAVHKALQAELFADGFGLNERLPFEARALRRSGEWRVFLLLTPWMLARVLVHDARPEIPLPVEEGTQPGMGGEPTVLGPSVTFDLLGSSQKAHLNHHPQLGHYLVQPLALSMSQYASADEVFAAWNTVIKTRDENVKRLERHCPWQEDVSRREFLKGLGLKRQAY